MLTRKQRQRWRPFFQREIPQLAREDTRRNLTHWYPTHSLWLSVSLVPPHPRYTIPSVSVTLAVGCIRPWAPCIAACLLALHSGDQLHCCVPTCLLPCLLTRLPLCLSAHLLYLPIYLPLYPSALSVSALLSLCPLCRCTAASLPLLD